MPSTHKNIRTIQVVNVRWFNATAWYGLFLARLLRDAGHETLVLTLPDTEPFVRAREWGLEPRALPLNTGNPLALARLFSTLAETVREFRPDVVDCHRGENFFLWELLRNRGHSFALVRTRGDQRPPRASRINKWLHQAADGLIATNSRTLQEFVDTLGCAPDTVRVVLGGVDTGIFRPDPEGRARVRAEYGFPDDSVVFGLLGRFDPVKGQRELIEALGCIRRGGSPPAASAEAWRSRIRLMLLGFPSNLSVPELEEALARHGLTSQAVITGKRPDVAACISSMDVGVVASQGSETIARAAFEIMSCGVPLVGTTVGVMPDLLPGWALAEPGNFRNLVPLLEQAASDADYRARLREVALQRISDLSERDFLRQTLAAYELALTRRRAQTGRKIQ